MSTQPLPLDWKVQPHISSRIMWDASVYRHFKASGSVSLSPTPSDPPWYCLRFEPNERDKFPERDGIYAFTYTHKSLGFPTQEIVLYIGEAENLRKRFRTYFDALENGVISSNDPPNTYPGRIGFMVSTFRNLYVRYRTLDGDKPLRKQLERNLIGLLDPPFNWMHRARPKMAPIFGRPGSTIPVKPKTKQSAF